MYVCEYAYWFTDFTSIYYLVFVSLMLDIGQVDDNNKLMVTSKFIAYFNKCAVYQTL